MIEDSDLEHISFSFVHGGFDPCGQGGCSCNICCNLREKIRTIHEKEIKECLNTQP